MRCDARNVSFLLLQLLVIVLFYTCQQVQPVQGYHRSLVLSMYIHASQSGDFVRARALYMLYLHRQQQNNFSTTAGIFILGSNKARRVIRSLFVVVPPCLVVYTHAYAHL